MFLRDTCRCEIYRSNIRDKRLPREACFDLGDVKVLKHIVTFNEEKDEDILMEEGPQIECVTVFLRDTCRQMGCTKETFVTSDQRVKHTLTRPMSIH